MTTLRKKHYFVADLHLGVGDSRKREQHVIRWLEMAKKDAEAVYLLGDIFDFWFEYRHVVPKGFIRLQGKLAELSDAGIAVHWFLGNHDMWLFNYFQEELGIQIHRGTLRTEIQGKKILMGHGDGLGPGDHRYKFIKKAFSCKLNQRLFAFLHPRIGIQLGNYFSHKSRLSHENNEEQFLGAENEMLIQYCEATAKKDPADYYIFGHRHLLIDHQLSDRSRYLNLGEWVHHSYYAVLENGELSIETFPNSSDFLTFAKPTETN